MDISFLVKMWEFPKLSPEQWSVYLIIFNIVTILFAKYSSYHNMYKVELILIKNVGYFCQNKGCKLRKYIFCVNKIASAVTDWKIFT